MSNRGTGYFIVLAVACICAIPVYARQNKATGNHSLHPATQTDAMNGYRVVLLPEFYNYKPVVKGDTTFKYECSKHHAPVNMDTLHSINDVDNIRFTKSYFQYPNTHKSAVSPPYVSEQIYEYERTGPGTWVRIDSRTAYQTDLKENKKMIVRTDTIGITNPQTRNKEQVICKYYKLIVLGQGHHTDDD
jgi:hypothetical protein